MHANERSEIKEVRAGDIAAAVGLKDVYHRRHAVVISRRSSRSRRWTFPMPGHLGGRGAEDQGRPGKDGPGAAAPREGRSVVPRVAPTRSPAQTIISGMGELHLEIIVDRMRREFKVEANVGKPQVAYRETIRGKVESEGKHIKQSGGRGQFGHVWLKIEPNEQGKGNEFINGIVGGSVPREFIPAVEKGIKEALETGVMAGYPGRRHQGHAVRRLVPRRRLGRNFVPHGRDLRLQGWLPQGEAGASSSPS